MYSVVSTASWGNPSLVTLRHPTVAWRAGTKTRFLAPIGCSKIPAQEKHRRVGRTEAVGRGRGRRKEQYKEKGRKERMRGREKKVG